MPIMAISRIMLKATMPLAPNNPASGAAKNE
jgi:hypothetical protein